jgi:hypothetical protein
MELVLFAWRSPFWSDAHRTTMVPAMPPPLELPWALQ